MQRPSTIKTGVWLLVISYLIFGIMMLLIQAPLDAVAIVIGLYCCFVYLIWKGHAWVRAVLLVSIILMVMRGAYIEMILFSSMAPIWPLCYVIFSITGTVYLYKKESNAWFSEMLFQEAQKNIAARGLVEKLKSKE